VIVKFTIAKFVAALTLGLFAAPLAAEAEQASKVHRIGVVVGGVDLTDNLRRGLRELGWVEGQNIVVLKRGWRGRTEEFPQILADLIQHKVDVIVSSSSPAVRAAMESTSTIPIVMAGLTDPVGAGLIRSLAQPGGNITGLTNIFTELSAKRLELLKEAAPRVSRVAVLWNPTHPGQAIAWQLTQQAAQALRLVLFSAEVRRPEDFAPAFAAIVAERAEALFVLPDPLTSLHRQQTADFAAKQRLPSMYAASYWAEAGGLLSYGTSFPDLWRRAAVYVDKILKGARPADLPVEQPTRFDLVVNLGTAKALGLTIPQSLLLRADHLIE
jgi:putative ABC transport system substrate-binding protein